MNHYSNSRLPSASLVVVSYNTADYIEGCLLSLLDLDYPQIEIIVVDNGSTDGSVELIRKRFPSDDYPNIEVIDLPENRGFAGGASVGLYMAGGEVVATVNPDVRLDPQWMAAMVDTLMSQEEVGIAGSKILYPDRETIQHAGGVFHYPLATTGHRGRGEQDHGQYNKPEQMSFVTGAAMAMRRDVGRDLGFFDERFYPVYYEDVDLCWRARESGLEVLYQPRAVAYHEETVTLDRRSRRYYSYFHANRLRFVVKHYSPEQVMLDFLPAEATRVAGDMEAEDKKASLALLDNPQSNDSERSSDTERKWAELRKHLDEVLAGWQVYEKSRPRRRRRGWRGRLDNLVSRLYVWPVVQKQIDYNASVARTLREMSRQLADLQARVGVQSVMSAALEVRQREEINELYAEVEMLRGQIDRVDVESKELDRSR